MKKDLYAELTEKILASLEQGVAPWRKDWVNWGGLPFNITTGKYYRGCNLLQLAFGPYSDPRWGTFKAMQDAAEAQARREGRELVVEIVKERGREKKKIWEIIDGERVWFSGGVRKGEKGTHIIFWKKVQKKVVAEGERPDYLLTKEYVVFNAAQCDGIPEREVKTFDFTPIQEAEHIANRYIWTKGSFNDGPPVNYGGDRACYDPYRDVVEMPEREQFKVPESYYGTLFHELVHSTGHKKRLDRLVPALFGTDPYAKEELVAEIGSAFLAGIAGIEAIDNSAAYISGWLKPLQNDKKFVISAAQQAQHAADLVLGPILKQQIEPEKDDNDEESNEQEKELVAA